VGNRLVPDFHASRRVDRHLVEGEVTVLVLDSAAGAGAGGRVPVN